MSQFVAWVGAALLVVAILGNLPALSARSSAQTIDCVQQITNAATEEEATFHLGAAISVANNSSRFQQMVSTFSSSFNSVFDLWSFDSNCSVTLTSVNIVFLLRNQTGWAGYAVVMEDSSASQVINVTAQQNRSIMNSCNPSSCPNWSGYEMYGNTDGTLPVWESTASWSVPSASRPNPPTNACVSKVCNVAIWTGLVHSPGGATGIAQAGSQSMLDCSSGCGSPSYNIWYEFLPANPVVCSTNVNSGDSIQAYVLNHGITPGGNTSLWDLQITDNTTSKSCTVSSHPDSGIGTPRYGEFIAERPLAGLVYETLPKFARVTFQGSIYYSGSLRGIYTPYSNGWYTQYVMQNSGYTNILTGAVISSNKFNETFNTAQGT